jgi:hypothetical protein
MEQVVGLADAVEALRVELTAAREFGADRELLFEVGPVEVEFTAVIKKVGGGKAGFTIGVVTLGGEASVAQEQTHRIKVTLTPKMRDTGATPQINDTDDRLPPA